MRNFDSTTFFAYARRAPFGGRLTQEQVDGTNAILAAWENDGDGDDRKLANVLAQVFHETGSRMVGVRETFASSDAQAISRLDAAWSAGRLPQVRAPYWRDGWFGRGPIQVTHERNYRAIGEALGVDLVANPGLLLELDIGARSAVVGMVRGLFTGKRLATYFTDKTDDPVGARRIVNGTDKAHLIAGYHRNFLDAITEARKVAASAAELDTREADVRPDDVKPEAAQPDGADLKRDAVTIGGMLQGLGGIGAVGVLLQHLNNPWAFAFAALLTAVVLIGGYLVFTGRVDLKHKAGA